MSRLIGLVGFGAVGREVAADLAGGAAGPCRLVVLLRPGSAARGRVPDGIGLVDDLGALAAARPGLVVEAAGAGAVRDLGVLLAAGITTLVTSVGALADDALLAALERAARAGGARLLLPAGAIGGLDYLAAARLLPGTRVVYESRKPPAAWADELARRGIAEGGLGEPLILFAGSAREAARLYPKNLNVAATLALAGVGMDATEVEVVVDPRAGGNTHAIRIDGPAGRFTAEIVNRPSAGNPKTSRIVAKSVVAAIARATAPVAVG